jgi:hypothetical protein
LLPQPALLALIGLLPTMALAAGQDGVAIAPHVRLERFHFDQNLLPDRGHAGFGAPRAM